MGCMVGQMSNGIERIEPVLKWTTEPELIEGRWYAVRALYDKDTKRPYHGVTVKCYDADKWLGGDSLETWVARGFELLGPLPE